jgi:hypothetical protein
MRRWSLFALLLSCSGPNKGGSSATAADSGEAVFDGDDDGFGAEEDCNDSDSAVHPGGVEVCDGVDNDCDGEVDEEVLQTYYEDGDGDGFGDPEQALEACSVPDGAAANGSDCDDAHELSYPGAAEICDGLDNDCDGNIDDNDVIPWYADADGDGFGDPEAVVESCSQPDGTVANGEDCDDEHPEVSPDGEEVCDELDNDCDGDVDEGTLRTYYEDRDEDGYGVGEAIVEACSLPAGYSEESGDCDDADEDFHPGADESDCADPNDYNCDGSVGYADADLDGYAACQECDDRSDEINPAATEICDGVDNDCDTYTDDADPSLDSSTASTWYDDDDADSYGDVSDARLACEAPSGWVADATDCDDRASAVHPAATEICNDIDDDCDSLVDDADSSLDLSSGLTWYGDADSDGHGSPASAVLACDLPSGASSLGDDCDDSSAAVHPGATELCNEIDDDCDSLVDDADSDLDLSSASTWYSDADGDGWGGSTSSRSCDAPASSSASTGDCDDREDAVYPGAAEICNDIDDDCDSLVDDADLDVDLSTGSDWFVDADSDGHGDAERGEPSCDAPTGSVALADDCDDSSALVSPDAVELCNDIDDDCDTFIDDADGDVDLASATLWYDDDDSDSYGDPLDSMRSCDLPSGHVSNDDDCDDTSASISPADAEICDSIDNDCDRLIDDADLSLDSSTATRWYDDDDSDSYGDPADSSLSCVSPTGHVTNDDDCNDSSASISPADTEICDGVDNDCDSAIDDADASVDLSTGSAWYDDDDADLYGDPTDSLRRCSQPSGYVSNDDDCNDANVAISPAGREICDSVDNDCDSAIDDADSSLELSSASTWYDDDDSDLYGDASDSLRRCLQPSGYVSNDDDCNDSSASASPAGTETCDGVDNDCDGTVDDGLTSASYSAAYASPYGSCNGYNNASVTVSVCGCPSVTVTGAFYDYSDGSSGQVVAQGLSSSSFSQYWDDCSSGCDCDLDIAAAVSVSASKSGTTLSVTVSNNIYGYDAGNSLGAGYSITSYGTYLRSSGADSTTFTYTCSY